MTLVATHIATWEVKANAPFANLLKRVRLHAQRRIAWLRFVWKQFAETTGNEPGMRMDVDGYLLRYDDAEAELEFYASNDTCPEIERQLIALDAERSKRYVQLVQALQLTPFEEDMLQVCFAAAIDPDLKKVLAYLHDDSTRPYVTEKIVAALFGPPQHMAVMPDSPLIRWNIVYRSRHANDDSLQLDPFIRHWLTGYSGIDESLLTWATIQTVLAPHQSWPLAETLARLRTLLHSDNMQVRLHVCGETGGGKKSFAASLCSMLGSQMVLIDAGYIPANQHYLVYLHAQRFAWLTQSIIAWHNLPEGFSFNAYQVPPGALQIVVGNGSEQLKPENGFTDIRVELPPLSQQQKHVLWQKYLPAYNGWTAKEQAILLSQHATIADITAPAMAEIGHVQEACAALQQSEAHKLGKLAQVADASFSRKQLVLPAAIHGILDDLVFEAMDRLTFWENEKARQLFPQGRSLVALFSGAPGTGKTMAAQVMAHELGLRLYRVDLSAVISKYIGESAKNLDRILHIAKHMNMILLFDEADALFGKRTETKDAHDRYANTDTNYLLQAIESYPGIVILSTNRKSNIDPAFIRRFRYAIEFPKPEVQQRKAIWISLIEALHNDATVLKLCNTIDLLAQHAELSGAQIKQALLSATFMCRRADQELGAPSLLRGVERELAKEGRTISKTLQQVLYA